MYRVITEFNRPSEDIPYYIDTNPVLKSEFLEFVSAVSHFSSNGQTILITSLDNIDLGTTQISTATYPDENSFTTFMTLFNTTFPTFFEDRDLYCATNNITVTRIVDTI